MTLAELRYLVAVADLRHFGRAAERCRITQPTLSSQLRKLEETLGVPLVERTTRFGDPHADRRERRRPCAPHPRGSRPDLGTGAPSPWHAHQRAASRHHPDAESLHPAAAARPAAPALSRASAGPAGGPDRQPDRRARGLHARRPADRAARAGRRASRDAAVPGAVLLRLPARAQAQQPPGRDGTRTGAASACCCSTKATACATRRWRCAATSTAAARTRTTISGQPAWRRSPRWLPRASAARCCRRWRCRT